MEGRVADRELRAEHAVHPAVAHKMASSGSISSPLRKRRRAAARRGAPCRARRHDGYAFPGLKKDRVVPPCARHGCAAVARPSPSCRGAGDRGGRIVQKATRREDEGDFARRPILLAERHIDGRQVSVGRRRWMIGFVEAKKRPGRQRPARGSRLGLQGRAWRSQIEGGAKADSPHTDSGKRPASR